MRVTRRTTAAGATAVAFVMTLAACGGTSAGEAGPSLRTHTDVGVYTWWAAGVEKTGLDALAEVFEKQHPDIEFVNDGVTGGGGSAAKDHLQSRLENQDPPDTFLVHAGAELEDYIKDGYVLDVSDLYEKYGLTEAFPKDLIERLSTDDGKIYSVPSNIHRANVMWANPTVLEDNGIDPSARYESIDAFITDLEKLDQAGVTPLSVGTTWTQVHLLETVLLGTLGPQAYNGLWNGSTDWTSAEVTAALENFKTLMSFTNSNREDIDWPDATKMVIDGEAAFNIMGDWAVSAFDEAEMTLGQGYVAVPSPGTAGSFDFLADSFTMTAGILDPESTEAWLQTISSKEGQVAFNKIKGSIPARTDVDRDEFTEYQRMAIKSFEEDTIVSSLAHGAAVPVAQLNAISEATRAFAGPSGHQDVARFQSDLAATAG
ncbi:ABC transporter substrate-binding protein [Myceligenerans pegani]|uniref:Probable sugar-binding periplasmic protein n=1 Tax=Myceligenerans pegani TaxID=2776917 RepID=A0ABR9MX53_9MICO|nr:ABC transporter substrate-binding protein [Myceligenerans sp. TRM 65318]MBE1875636.1 carbohydrate ABC transporter substrate-binding protein [Myceligenerans sp. TRM 65318]MBE3017907.1 carbohydrate ABC transporter substrate-binding protein [Myceligenerans sp. TRM 65318]